MSLLVIVIIIISLFCRAPAVRRALIRKTDLGAAAVKSESAGEHRNHTGHFLTPEQLSFRSEAGTVTLRWIMTLLSSATCKISILIKSSLKQSFLYITFQKCFSSFILFLFSVFLSWRFVKHFVCCVNIPYYFINNNNNNYYNYNSLTLWGTNTRSTFLCTSFLITDELIVVIINRRYLFLIGGLSDKLRTSWVKVKGEWAELVSREARQGFQGYELISCFITVSAAVMQRLNFTADGRAQVLVSSRHRRLERRNPASF